MDIKRYRKGVIIGFLIGVASVPLALLGLGSIFGMIFYPLIILPKLITAGYQSIPVLVVASIAIHMTMMWSDRVTMVMVDKNRSIDPVKTCSERMSAFSRYPVV